MIVIVIVIDDVPRIFFLFVGEVVEPPVVRPYKRIR